MLLLLASDVLGLPLLVAVGLMLLIIVLGGWLDSRVHWLAAAPATGDHRHDLIDEN
jgi:hypothetical protein